MENSLYSCAECGKFFIKQKNLFDHEKTHAGSSRYLTIFPLPQENIKRIRSAFQTRIQTLVFENNDEGCLFPEEFLNKAWLALKPEISLWLNHYKAMKINTELHGLYAKLSVEDMENTPLEVKTFQTKMQQIFNENDFNEVFALKIKTIINKMDEFQERDSGWTLVQIIKLETNLNKYQPLKGSTFIPLPQKLSARKACINVQNNDKFCFKWAVLSAIYNLNRDGHRISSYPVNINSTKIATTGGMLNFEGLCFPLQIRDVELFEKLNEWVSINVFGYDEEKNIVIGPYYKTKEVKLAHINLLFLQKETNSGTTSHYVWIKNISR